MIWSHRVLVCDGLLDIPFSRFCLLLFESFHCNLRGVSCYRESFRGGRAGHGWFDPVQLHNVGTKHEQPEGWAALETS